MQIINQIKTNVSLERSTLKKLLWIYRGVLSLLLFAPIFYILGFVVGILAITNPHATGKELLSTLY